MKVKDVWFTGPELLVQFGIFYMGPYRLTKTYTKELLKKAPLWKELKKEDKIGF